MADTVTATALQGETLDALCWRVLGQTAGGVVEQALRLNRDLADAGAFLAEGQAVILPAQTTPAAATLDIVQLWS